MEAKPEAADKEKEADEAKRAKKENSWGFPHGAGEAMALGKSAARSWECLEFAAVAFEKLDRVKTPRGNNDMSAKALSKILPERAEPVFLHRLWDSDSPT